MMSFIIIIIQPAEFIMSFVQTCCIYTPIACYTSLWSADLIQIKRNQLAEGVNEHEDQALHSRRIFAVVWWAFQSTELTSVPLNLFPMEFNQWDEFLQDLKDIKLEFGNFWYTQNHGNVSIDLNEFTKTQYSTHNILYEDNCNVRLPIKIIYYGLLNFYSWIQVTFTGYRSILGFCCLAFHTIPPS